MSEKKTIEFMIKLYCSKNCSKNHNKNHNKNNSKNHSKNHSKNCSKNHNTKIGDELCEECKTLFEYACKRIDNCRFKETKTFCSMCTSHCYSPAMKESIRQVMKFSGPRMLIYNPPLAISHIFYTVKSKLGGC